MSKNPWSKARLLQYIDKEESYALEFKSSTALLDPSRSKVDSYFDDLSKHISAFLNSEGGTLIIGLEEPKPRNDRSADKAVDLSPGVPRSLYSGTRLSSALCDRIHPSVGSNVQVNTVVVDERNGEELLAFAIEVRQGVTAYQAADKRYYGRRSFSSEALEDKEIRLRMLSDEKPRATIAVNIDAGPPQSSWEKWEAELQKYFNAIDLWRLDAAPLKQKPVESLTEDDLMVLAEAPPQGGGSARIETIQFHVKLIVTNVGLITIRRLAIRHDLDVPDDCALQSTKPSSGLEEVLLDQGGAIPLYPELSKEIFSIVLKVPLGRDLPGDGVTLSAVVYLDGGQAVRLDEDITASLQGAAREFRSRLEQELAPHRCTRFWPFLESMLQ